ncbi:unnamed protein product [Durusdinium trenchii]
MEKRTDPYDGKTQTLQEMIQKYQGVYSKSEVESYFQSECTVVVAPKSKAGYVTPAAPSSVAPEMEGLRAWLKQEGYEKYLTQVQHWCEENGAVMLEEVQENWDDILPELKDLSPEVPKKEEKASKPSFAVAGLEEWLEEIDLEEYLEDVLEWCEEHHVVRLKEIQVKWEGILQDLKLKTAKEQLPGKKVSVRVLVGKWQGTYMALVLNVTDAGIRIKHLEDDFEETLPLDALGGGKYLLEPVDSDEEEEMEVKDLLRKGRLSVATGDGAGLELRWVKLGYAVDQVLPKPGQRDLHPGDVILWINGMSLLALDEDTVTDRFSEAFGDHVPLVAGKLSELMKHPMEKIQKEVQSLVASK